VATLDALRALAPDLGRLGRLAKDRGVRGIVLTARETREPGALTHSRNFIPHFGIPEDFATGSSHAAIGAWLWETGGLVAAAGVARFRGEQGDFQGRPGRIAVEVHGVPGRATRVRVGGQAVIVMTGQLSLP
jgi:PhzF family phenazine biosynthesis protein